MHLPSWTHSNTNKKIAVSIVVIALVLFLVNEKKKQDNGIYPMAEDAAQFGGSTGGMGYDYDMYGGEKAGVMAREQAASTRGMPTPMPPPYSPGGTAPLDEVLRDDRMIIRNGSVSAVVDNVRAAIEDITTKVTSLDGFIASSSVNEYQIAPTAYLTVRVPVAQFDAVLLHLRSTYRVVSESVSGDDVTEQAVDLEARLKNLEASEAQFQEIMDRATRIEDVLNVQQQLERVRGEIESYTAQLENLTRAAALSTLSISLSTEQDELPIVDPTEKWSPLATFKEAIRDFRMLLIDVADMLIASSLYLAAIGLVFLAYRLWVWMHRR